jgi:putative membrane-bound dehydrogenase-like protein
MTKALLRSIAARARAAVPGLMAMSVAAPLLARPAPAAAGPAFELADGLVAELAAAPPAVRFPMFATFDDEGRLYVAESSGLDLYEELKRQTRRCRVSRLEDQDGDGRFETATVFADGLVFPMGLAWRDGRLYVADPPALVALSDRDGDGRADTREVILSGFGHTDNGSLHGLTFGPDGWLYMTMGHPDGYRLTDRDGSILEGRSGALIRARLGAGRPRVEVLARGFENLVEVDFLPSGEIVGTDNWYARPVGGLRDALVHLVDGGRYPLHPEDEGTRYPVTGEALPPLAMFPAVAHSGLVRLRTKGLGRDLEGALVSAQHNTRKVVWHKLARDGATFSAQTQDLLASSDPDFHPSDVVEDADGSLLVVDTGAWYIHHCPTGRIRTAPAEGGIWRLRRKGAPRSRDAWGRGLDWRGPPAALVEALGDERRVVRARAVDLLVARGQAAIPRLAQRLGEPTASVLVKEQALAALARIDAPAALVPLRAQLAGAGTPELTAAAARLLGTRRDGAAAPALARLLDRPESFVRLAAAEALARSGSPAQVPALVGALSVADGDPFLRHGLALALDRLAPPTHLARLLDHASPAVQAAALWLLDQPGRAKGRPLSPAAVLTRSRSAHPGLRRAAVASLRRHPEWGSAAAPFIRGLIAARDLPADDEALLVDLIVAWRKAAPVVSAVAAAFEPPPAPGTMTPPARLVGLLGAIARVDRRELPDAWRASLSRALAHEESSVRSAATRALGALQIGEFDPGLSEITADSRASNDLRLSAMRALAPRRPDRSEAELALLVAALDVKRPPLERLAAAEVIGASRLTTPQVAAVARALVGDPVVPVAVVLRAARRVALDESAGRAMLAYLAAGADLGWTFPAADLEAIRSSLPRTLAAEAAPIWTAVGEALTRQRQELARLAPLLEGGDDGRGEALFFGKAACGACHQVGPRGGLVGPDLTKIGAIRAGRDLLESIVLPSASFAQQYEPYAVSTKDGETRAGVKVSESPEAVELRDAAGNLARIPKDRIDRLERGAISIMPEGLLGALSDEEIRDLLRFVQSLR